MITRLLIAGICLPFLFSGLAHSHQITIFVEHLSIAFALIFVAWWNWRSREPRPA
jgi:predicted membrane channel-forming protein YqfA (hemolysin III family)